MSEIAYRVRGWDEHFEKGQRKDRTKAKWRWVALPNKHDGKGYRLLIRQPDGPALFGAWCAVIQVSSKCPTRGVLVDDDGPLTPESLELKTDIPADVFARCLEVCSKIGWLESFECQTDVRQVPTDDGLHNKTGQDRTGEKKREHSFYNSGSESQSQRSFQHDTALLNSLAEIWKKEKRGGVIIRNRRLADSLSHLAASGIGDPVAHLRQQMASYVGSAQGKSEFCKLLPKWCEDGCYLQDPSEWDEDKKKSAMDEYIENERAKLEQENASQ